MPGSPSVTPRRSLAVKRSAPSDGFQASPVPSKFRNVRGIPRQTVGQPGSLTVTAGSTVARQTRRGSRFASVTTASGVYEDDESLPYERHGSVGLGSIVSEYGTRHQAPKHGLRRGAVLAKDQIYKVSATGDVPADVWNLMQSFGACSYPLCVIVILMTTSCRRRQGCLEHKSLYRSYYWLGCSFHLNRYLRLEPRQTHGFRLADLLHLSARQIISPVQHAIDCACAAKSCICCRKRAGTAVCLPKHRANSMLG